MKYTGGGAKLNTTASGGSIAFFAPEWLRPFKGHKRLKLAVVQEEAVPRLSTESGGDEGSPSPGHFGRCQAPGRIKRIAIART
jgi:hypothetical protein